jgi:hypothetical protein
MPPCSSWSRPRKAITALVRELALQSQLVARDTDHWMLRVERESLNQPASRERLQNALAAAGHAVQLAVEVGRVTDSPARRNAARRPSASWPPRNHPQRPLRAGDDAGLWRENRARQHQACLITLCKFLTPTEATKETPCSTKDNSPA